MTVAEAILKVSFSVGKIEKDGQAKLMYEVHYNELRRWYQNQDTEIKIYSRIVPTRKVSAIEYTISYTQYGEYEPDYSGESISLVLSEWRRSEEHSDSWLCKVKSFTLSHSQNEIEDLMKPIIEFDPFKEDEETQTI